jgi:hypothetical protein
MISSRPSTRSVAFTPSIRPKSANATVIANPVRTASSGLRHRALQISGTYFTDVAYFQRGMNSSSTACRMRSGGSSPWLRMKSWNRLASNFDPNAFSVSLRSDSSRV